jgi:hypothetical protein
MVSLGMADASEGTICEWVERLCMHSSSINSSSSSSGVLLTTARVHACSTSPS